MNQRSEILHSHRLLHNALTLKRIEAEVIEFMACESLHLMRLLS